MTIPVNNFFSKSKPSSPTGSSFDTYKSLQQYKTSTSTLVEYHLNNILKAMRIKLKENQTFVNPYNPNFNEKIHPEIFYKIYRTVRDSSNKYGIVCPATKGKKGNKSYQMEFKNYEIWNYHATKLHNQKYDPLHNYLFKTFPSKSTAKVIINLDKPLIITYKVSTTTCCLSFFYSLTNQHGTIVSY